MVEDHRVLTLDFDALAREVREQASQPLGKEQKTFADMLRRVKPYYQA